MLWADQSFTLSLHFAEWDNTSEMSGQWRAVETGKRSPEVELEVRWCKEVVPPQVAKDTGMETGEGPAEFTLPVLTGGSSATLLLGPCICFEMPLVQ